MGYSVKKMMKRNFPIIMVLLTGLVVSNLSIAAVCYQNYQDKMEILCWMSVTDDKERDIQMNMLDRAVWMIKEGGAQPAQLLEKYGYQDSLQNRYYVLFLKQCLFFAGFSSMFFAGCYLMFAAYRKREQNTYREYFMALAGNIAVFRGGRASQTGKANEAKEAKAVFSFPGCEAEEDYLCDQLEMLEEELSVMREKAFAEKERTKGIVTDLSHQLKTPVAALDTCFAVLEDQTLCEEERIEFYARCRQELEGLKALLDALVQISQMESGMIRIVPKQEVLLDTLLAAVNRIYPKACRKQIELVFDDAAEVEGMEILHDAKWLCEAFVNLLDNAVKYSPAGSEIRIGIQRQVSFVRIQIQDQGIGIAKKEQHKVFQRFYRGTDQRVQAQGGSGVGLYLVRRIIEEHHGNVSVRSARGKKEGYPGSVFVVHIPQ